MVRIAKYGVPVCRGNELGRNPVIVESVLDRCVAGRVHAPMATPLRREG